jgi:hypothetical protein
MKPADTYSLCAGLFDDQSRHTLDNEIFIDEKPDGYELGGDLPKMTGAEAIAKYMSNN